jgi:hypothetical protein
MSAIHAAMSARDPHLTGQRAHPPRASAPPAGTRAGAREQPQYTQADEQPEQTGSAAAGLPE